MTRLLRNIFSVFLLLTLSPLLLSCASTKTIKVWKDEGYSQRLRKVLVIAVADQDYMRNHFENVLSNSLTSRGIEAVPSNKIFPQSLKLDRKAIEAKVRELGIGSVLVTRSTGKTEESWLDPGYTFVVPVGYYEWYGFYSDSFAMVTIPGQAYDAEFFSLTTNIYDVSSEKLIWSYLSRVKVEQSKEGAINPFIDTLMKQLDENKLL